MNHERKDIAENDADAVLRAVADLPQAIEPQRDLWPAIARGLDEAAQAQHTGKPWAWAAAAAAAGIALGALVAYSMLGRETAPSIPTNAAIAASNNKPVFAAAAFGRYAALGPDYERARGALLIDLAERLDRLPPEARLKVERNLAEIQRSVGEINAALELAPDDRLLQELLLSTYQDELGVLAHVNQIAGALPART